jgi:RNA polymerase sigma-70 factor (ECF subfamily)
MALSSAKVPLAPAPGPGLGSADDELRAHELARAAAAGESSATRELLGLVWPTAVRVVAGVLGASHPDLDDVVQQSLIALLGALPGFRGECHPVGYASRIALRTALKARRRSKLDASRRDLLARLSGDEPTTLSEQEPLEERRRKLLRELLEDLPEEQAEALALRVMLGWSLDEVARASNAPSNTVRSRVRLAKEALRRRLEAAPELADQLKGEP